MDFDFLKFLDEHFTTIWLLCFGWVVCVFTFKYFWHRSKGRFLKDPPEDQVLYQEGFASGRSHRAGFFRRGSAANCLKVTLTPDRLLIRPFFPFSILGPDFDLIHDIPLSAIEGFKTKQGFITRALEIRYRSPKDEPRGFDLMPKRSSEFRIALEAAIAASQEPNQRATDNDGAVPRRV
jgi:hypothetical protein